MKVSNSRALRVIINGVVLNTTKGKIVASNSIFGDSTQQQAVIDTLEELESMLATKTTRSLSQNINNIQVQVDLV